VSLTFPPTPNKYLAPKVKDTNNFPIKKTKVIFYFEAQEEVMNYGGEVEG
jgi:hypothetical protein